MGYDYYVRSEEKPPSPQVDWSAANYATGEGLEEYRAWERDWYFRRNIFGGSRLADALLDLGMGFDAHAYGRPPEWPKPEEYGVEYREEKLPDGEWECGYVGERAKEFEEASNAVLDWHGPEIPGIPIHKVAGSNDGWHVTREEAKSALLIYERALADGKTRPEVFGSGIDGADGDDFIHFLRRAAAHDGFETH